MCFTPAISLTTAIFEVVMASIILLNFKKSHLRNMFVVTIFLLAIYQFTEFMLCSSGNPFLWAILGIITYSFLPAVILHGTLKYVGRKVNLVLLYFIPVIISYVTISLSHFIIDASCEKYFVTVLSVFNRNSSLEFLIPFKIYLIYYAGFILFAAYLIFRDYKTHKDKIKRKVDVYCLFSFLLAGIPTLIFLIVFPFLGLLFPSVLCQFAVFIAIAMFMAAHFESKLTK